MIILGIDNGISGGCCAISQATGQIISMIPMPTKKVIGKNAVDTRKFWLWFHDTTQGQPTTIILERPAGSKSARAGISMGGSFHALRGAIESRGLEIGYITPKAWQKALGVNSDEKKSKAIKLAQELWPDESWLASPRCSTPHTGMVDSALIAENHRRLIN